MLCKHNSTCNVGLDTDTDSADPKFGPFYIRCAGNEIASFTLQETLGSSITILLVFRIQSSSSTSQVILGISVGSVVFKIQYLPDDGSLQFIAGSNSIKTPATTITQGFQNYFTHLTKL